MQEIRIKNMVCQRCVLVLKMLLDQANISYSEVEMGYAKLTQKLSLEQEQMLSHKLEDLGFELLNDENKVLIESIKMLMREWVFQKAEQRPLLKLSEHLSKELERDYSGISRFFSAIEGLTIEKYLKKLKVERAKELLVYDRLSLSEIAHELDYANASYLTALFKKETGISPKEFKQNHPGHRKSLDEL